ncbi:hypothetical protein MTR67_001074 [Solanum verrucosum]|uniref:Integrase zinc-binding domain-containing protein n=1 Tax=Solanum verrucosum TaxID=315347 RepID=A0AAF0T7J4_SOLVR|nr:hypothetical protein MTR67_001074 [Solanum verrucosum]
MWMMVTFLILDPVDKVVINFGKGFLVKGRDGRQAQPSGSGSSAARQSIFYALQTRHMITRVLWMMLPAKFRKCDFWLRFVTFLGHIVSDEGIGLGCVLMQHRKVTTYASRKLKMDEKNYPTHDLDLVLVVLLYVEGDKKELAHDIHRLARLGIRLVESKEGATKMYHGLWEVYWWNKMKKDIAEFMTKCLNCQQVKVEHTKPGGLAQNISFPT